MRKQKKGTAGRKPPQPATNHSDIHDWFGPQMPHLQLIVEQLDESIRATIPGLHYAVKWKREHLPAVPNVHEPSGANYGRTEVVPVPLGCLTGMQAHSDTEHGRCGPVFRRQRGLRCCCGVERLPRSS
jgi:hypothetical protein